MEALLFQQWNKKYTLTEAINKSKTSYTYIGDFFHYKKPKCNLNMKNVMESFTLDKTYMRPTQA